MQRYSLLAYGNEFTSRFVIIYFLNKPAITQLLVKREWFGQSLLVFPNEITSTHRRIIFKIRHAALYSSLVPNRFIKLPTLAFKIETSLWRKNLIKHEWFLNQPSQ